MRKILMWLALGLLMLMVSGCDIASDGNDNGEVENDNDYSYNDDEDEALPDEEMEDEETEEIEDETEEEEEEEGTLQLISLSEGDTLDASGSTTLVGQAPGSWYFEGVFTVQVQDGYGNVLTETQVTATEEWMTTDLVRFTATLDPFETNGVTRGMLVFIKDNPSGLPEYDESVSVEVEFTDSEESSASSVSAVWDVKANSRN